MWILNKNDLISFVTDIFGHRQNQIYMLPNFSENIGGREHFQRIF